MLRVLRFNWPKLLGAVLFSVGCFSFLVPWASGFWRVLFVLLGIGPMYFVTASLAATWWVYDRGQIEKLSWLVEKRGPISGAVASVHVGYDDTRAGLENISAESVTGIYYPITTHGASWHGHSLARAIQHDDRTNEPLLQDTVRSGHVFNLVMLGFAAHELRNDVDRRQLISMASKLVDIGGELLVVEHTRDIANTAVYGPGAWHFLPESTWLADFDAAELEVTDSYRVGGLINAFVLARRHP